MPIQININMIVEKSFSHLYSLATALVAILGQAAKSDTSSEGIERDGEGEGEGAGRRPLRFSFGVGGTGHSDLALDRDAPPWSGGLDRDATTLEGALTLEPSSSFSSVRKLAYF